MKNHVKIVNFPKLEFFVSVGGQLPSLFFLVAICQSIYSTFMANAGQTLHWQKVASTKTQGLQGRRVREVKETDTYKNHYRSLASWCRQCFNARS